MFVYSQVSHNQTYLKMLVFAATLGCLVSTAVAQLPEGAEISSKDLGEIERYLSPPILSRPYFICADVIAVSGIVPGAQVELEVVIGGQITTLNQIVPHDTQTTFQLPGPFETIQDTARARQILGADKSAWDRESSSPDNHALDVSTTFPDGLPVPRVYWEPFFNCGIRVGVSNIIPGSSEVWATVHPPSDPEYTLFKNLQVAGHASEGDGPAFRTESTIVGYYMFCGETAYSRQAGHNYEVIDLPQMPDGPPEPEIGKVFEDQNIIEVNGLMNGAKVLVYDTQDQLIASGGTVSESRGLRANRALVAGENLRVQQTYEACNLSSPKDGALVEVLPCSELGAPEIRRPVPGDEEVVVVKNTPGAAIVIFDASNKVIGHGTAPRVPLARPLVTTEELRVIQVLGNCRSSMAYKINVDCGPKSRGELDLLNLLPNRAQRRGSSLLTANVCP